MPLEVRADVVTDDQARRLPSAEAIDKRTLEHLRRAVGVRLARTSHRAFHEFHEVVIVGVAGA